MLGPVYSVRFSLDRIDRCSYNPNEMAPRDDRTAFMPIARGCLARKLRMLNRRVTGLYDDVLRGHGLRVTQMNVLVAVAVLGPTTQSAVAEKLMLEKSTLSRNLDRMCEKGWVLVGEGPDGRSNELTLTRAGRKLLEDVTPAWRDVQRRVKRLIGDDAVDSVDHMLVALATSDG